MKIKNSTNQSLKSGLSTPLSRGFSAISNNTGLPKIEGISRTWKQKTAKNGGKR